MDAKSILARQDIGERTKSVALVRLQNPHASAQDMAHALGVSKSVVRRSLLILRARQLLPEYRRA